MGVQGLWSILEPTGKVVSVETLENQILAIDISLWLHQSVKGFRNPGADGVAHILGLFHRLCKLLFYGIRPVFVFDGRNIPQLKKETLLKRRLRTRSSKEKVAESLRTKALLGHLMTQVSQIQSKSTSRTLEMQKALKYGQKGLSNLLSRRTGNTSNPNANDKDIFELPPLPSRSGISENEDSDIDEEILNYKFKKSASSIVVDDIHDVDIKSDAFKSLPMDQQYNILFEMKEKRKMNSWAKIDSMPKKAENFSDFQVQRLLKRANIQKTMEKVEKDLGDKELDLIDPHLFVGDKKGIKAMRLASDNKKSIIYGPRRQQKEDSVAIKTLTKSDPDDPKPSGSSIDSQPSSSKQYSNEETQNALLQMMSETECASTKTEIDEDILTQEALLQSIASTHNPTSSLVKGDNNDVIQSQEALLQSIKIENYQLEEEIIDDDIVIFAPSLTHNSNQRHGGKHTHVETKCEPIPCTSRSFSETSDSEEINDVGIMSSSSDESEDDSFKVKDPNHDIFADVFKEKKSFEEFDRILLHTKSVKPTMLRKKSKKASDSSSSSSVSSNPPSPVQASSDISSQESNDASKDSEVIKELSNTMKNSEHLWLKIASKHVPIKETLTHQDAKEDKEESVDDKSNKLTESLINEGKMLVKEMKNSERENRLLKYQDINYTSNQEEVFGSSAPGFVRGGTSTNVQEVDVEPSAEALIQETANSFAKDDNSLDVRDLVYLQNKLAAERETIIAEASRQEKLAASITDQMYQECQELLQIFGIPYVVAPGEAEAQCAYLENIKLTNGTVTDDSDVWVFGSKKVYKNFFEKEKFVEFFSISEIEKKLGLTQGKMISIAMLTGSDYTEGIYNVGPITALEILAEFPGEELEPLNGFKEWLEENKKTDFAMPISRVRENFKRLDVIEGFPSQVVLDAYKSPLVDTSDEKFTWAVPNFVAIRDYATEKFGFTYAKVDEMLSPIVKRIRAKSLQTRIENYFVNNDLSSIRQKEMTSKRGLSAIERVKGKASVSPVKSHAAKNTKKTGSLKRKNQKETIPQKILSNEEKNNLIKKRAAEVLKRDTKRNKKMKRPKRITLTDHNLSEESDD